MIQFDAHIFQMGWNLTLRNSPNLLGRLAPEILGNFPSLCEWVQNGCPWHFAMKHQCHTHVRGVPILMAANRGQDNFQPIDGSIACRACRALCHNGEFSERVATWHYRIDLADLVLATALSNEQKRNNCCSKWHAHPTSDTHRLQSMCLLCKGPTLLPGKARTTKWAYSCDMCSCQAAVWTRRLVFFILKPR